MMVFIFRCFLLFAILCGGATEVAAKGAGEQVVAFTFDWDDNIFVMPTKIMVFHKKSGEDLGISTGDFALVREEIGKPGSKYADYEMRDSPATGSLRYFGDFSEDGDMRFQKDIDASLTGKPETWQGPVWRDFVSAMDHESSASHTWIITARIHSPKTIYTALTRLQERGLIKHVPPIENLWPVSEPTFPERFKQTFGAESPAGSGASPSARKAAVMEQILDQVEKTRLPESAPEVLSPDGKNRGRFHLWGFSDDDFGNFQKAVQVLQKGLDAGRWTTVKITVFYTGRNHPGVAPHSVTLRPGDKPRPFAENLEWKEILNSSDTILLPSNPEPSASQPVSLH